MPIVETDKLTKVHGRGETAVTALDNVSLCLQTGEFVAVMGPSGCGKSTLLHLIGGLDRPSSGRVLLDGHDLAELGDNHVTELRRRRIGLVFQFYNLLPVLTVAENAALPLLLDGLKPAEARRRAAEWLGRVGLPERGEAKPHEISGGQQQRVAIARALVTEPAVILADEPTGNLDSKASDETAALLRQVCDEWQGTVLMVTHDPRLAAYADRIIFLKDGAIVDETRLADHESVSAGAAAGSATGPTGAKARAEARKRTEKRVREKMEGLQ